jgi:hypothetical protein
VTTVFDAVTDPRSRLAGLPVERAAHFVRLLPSSRMVLDADASLRALLADALPSERTRWDGKPLGVISARCEDVDGGPAPARAPTMRVSGIAAWVDVPAPGLSVIRNENGAVHGTVDRGARRATLRVRSELTAPERADAGVALGVAVTLLAGHVGHALVHAGAVVPPGGGAWLLVGDSRSGKSTSTAALVAAGWDYLSDDSVMLSPAAGDRVLVEGWRRGFRLDRDAGAHASADARMFIEEDALGGGAWRASAPLGGVLFPMVRADETTRLEPISRVDAFAALVRQSPWLLADRGASPQCASLLAHATETPMARLVLGTDSHRRGDLLAEVLAPLLAIA